MGCKAPAAPGCLVDSSALFLGNIDPSNLLREAYGGFHSSRGTRKGLNRGSQRKGPSRNFVLAIATQYLPVSLSSVAERTVNLAIGAEKRAGGAGKGWGPEWAETADPVRRFSPKGPDRLSHDSPTPGLGYDGSSG